MSQDEIRDLQSDLDQVLSALESAGGGSAPSAARFALMGAVYEDHGVYERALQHYQRALQLVDVPEYRFLYDRCYRRGVE
jgi:tetratricopeptide (TPR) repeat protein